MIEPEDIIESKLLAALSSALPDMHFIGGLSPVAEYEQKLSADTFVSVVVDLTSQDLDWQGPGEPRTWSVRVNVRFNASDDSSGNGFRDTCRAVRGVLAACLGDDCAALDGDGFSCDGFTLDSTATDFMGDADSGTFAKTYNATVKGRFTPQQETPQEAE